MKKKDPDKFIPTQTSDTAAVIGDYSARLTPIDMGYNVVYAQKQEISHIKEIYDIKIGELENKIRDIKDALSEREIRLWTILGIILTILVTIFLFALPEMYKRDYSEKYQKIIDTNDKFDVRIKSLENKSYPNKNRKN